MDLVVTPSMREKVGVDGSGLGLDVSFVIFVLKIKVFILNVDAFLWIRPFICMYASYIVV